MNRSSVYGAAGGDPMTAPTAREVRLEIQRLIAPSPNWGFFNPQGIEAVIDRALKAERAATWRAAAEVVRTGTLVFQSDPPMAVSPGTLEALRAQFVAALAARGEE